MKITIVLTDEVIQEIKTFWWQERNRGLEDVIANYIGQQRSRSAMSELKTRPLEFVK